VCTKVNDQRCIKKEHYEICSKHGTAKNPWFACPQCVGEAERARQAERQAELEKNTAKTPKSGKKGKGRGDDQGGRDSVEKRKKGERKSASSSEGEGGK
jgi:hypothetical protein